VCLTHKYVAHMTYMVRPRPLQTCRAHTYGTEGEQAAAARTNVPDAQAETRGPER
jgi:hypothetical protein